jgi:hypothetical protein
MSNDYIPQSDGKFLVCQYTRRDKSSMSGARVRTPLLSKQRVRF